MKTKKTLNDWLVEYSKDHQNPTNKKLHKIFVPLIFFCSLAMLFEIPHSFSISYFGWDLVLTLVAALFYARLSLKLSFFMTLMMLALHVIYVGLSSYDLAPYYIAGFVVGWIGQAIGHKYEGAKPSFFKDLSYLFIGPIWIFH